MSPGLQVWNHGCAWHGCYCGVQGKHGLSPRHSSFEITGLSLPQTHTQNPWPLTKLRASLQAKKICLCSGMLAPPVPPDLGAPFLPLSQPCPSNSLRPSHTHTDSHTCTHTHATFSNSNRLLCLNIQQLIPVPGVPRPKPFLFWMAWAATKTGKGGEGT